MVYCEITLKIISVKKIILCVNNKGMRTYVFSASACKSLLCEQLTGGLIGSPVLGVP